MPLSFVGSINHVQDGEMFNEITMQRPTLELEVRTDALKDYINANEGTWGGGAADNLGNHTATESLDMNSYSVLQVQNIHGREGSGVDASFTLFGGYDTGTDHGGTITLLSGGSGTSGQMVLQTYNANISGPIQLTTGDAAVGDSGDIELRTGAGGPTGTTGNIDLIIGADGAAPGLIRFQNGSEGTAGHVWTQVADPLGGVTGRGEWQLPQLVSHDIADHDTSATGSQLDTLTAGPTSDADALHTHDTLAATGDNLGDHTATEALKMDDNHITGIKGLTGDTNSTLSIFNIIGSSSTASGSHIVNIQSNGGNNSGNVTLWSGGASTGDSGELTLKTGPSTSGDSGDVLISTGAATSGTRGYVDISGEDIRLHPAATPVPTVGDVWTATATNGSGDWADPLADHSISDLHDNATSGAIDWNDGISQEIDISGNLTITMANPKSGRAYAVKFVHTATATKTITWPTNVRWAGTAPALSTVDTTIDIFSFFYDGTDYFGSYTLGY